MTENLEEIDYSDLEDSQSEANSNPKPNYDAQEQKPFRIGEFAKLYFNHDSCISWISNFLIIFVFAAGKEGGRDLILCEICGKYFVKIVPHLQKIHKKTVQYSLNYRLIHDCRKRPVRNEKNSNKYRKLKTCPTCGKMVRKLTQHIKKVHNKKQKVINSKVFKAGQGAEEDASSESESEARSQKIPSRLNSILDRFKDWLQSPLGGRKEESTSQQFRVCITKILQATEPEFIDVLFEPTTINTVLTILEKKGYGPRSLQRYVSAVRKFIDFYRCTFEDSKRLYYTCLMRGYPQPRSIDNAVHQLKLMSTAYNKPERKKAFEIIQRDRENYLTQEEVLRFRDHPVPRWCAKTLKKGINKILSPEETTLQGINLMRSYLIMEIILNNAPRPGLLTELTVGDYMKATHDQDDIVISVFQHKTTSTQGKNKKVSWRNEYFA